MHSSQKHTRDAEARQARVERSLQALAALSERLAGPRARLRTRVTVEEAVRAAVTGAGAERWITWQLSEQEQQTYRLCRRWT